jgi:hypothetical protein
MWLDRIRAAGDGAGHAKSHHADADGRSGKHVSNMPCADLFSMARREGGERQQHDGRHQVMPSRQVKSIG